MLKKKRDSQTDRSSAEKAETLTKEVAPLCFLISAFQLSVFQLSDVVRFVRLFANNSRRRINAFEHDVTECFFIAKSLFCIEHFQTSQSTVAIVLSRDAGRSSRLRGNYGVTDPAGNDVNSAATTN